ncbi:uncharacterized protein LOC124310241 [Neodiprion virginianus]|uniref:uncharacterized protein LOC124310241 n=1 Tax=Neodiprion virginianus TaxID=2961670 RepID=UPI001EE6F4D1|nr:uncharacterized protein LOC124310241 [Neodiprion virginianus]
MPGVRCVNTGPGAVSEAGILQINLDRSQAAQDLPTQTAVAMGASILLVSEPSRAGKQGNWLVDTRGDAAILGTRNLTSNLTLGGRGEGFVWVRVGNTSVFSCYFSPNTLRQALEMRLDGLEEAVRAAGCRILIAGDFNAKSPLWGSDRRDKRGEIVAKFLARLDL